PTAKAWLLAELGGASHQLDDAAYALITTARTAPGFSGAEVITDPGRSAAIWRIREDGAGLGTTLPEGSEPWPGWEDAAVPPAKLGSYLRGFTTLLDQHGL